ncbi:MAG: hypothetical protein VZR14_03810 [Hallerella sp.]|nr:hypothetical protein [Hallerella sp.]
MRYVKTCLRVLLGLFMTYAGVSHLTIARQEFLAQVPSWLPQSPGFMDFVVLASGVVEIALGLGMILLYKYKGIVGVLLALFYVAIFPGNISQYVNGISAFGLDTDQARLIRLFFQPVLIAWALWSTDGIAQIKAWVARFRK